MYYKSKVRETFQGGEKLWVETQRRMHCKFKERQPMKVCKDSHCLSSLQEKRTFSVPLLGSTFGFLLLEKEPLCNRRSLLQLCWRERQNESSLGIGMVSVRTTSKIGRYEPKWITIMFLHSRYPFGAKKPEQWTSWDHQWVILFQVYNLKGIF